MRKYFVALLLIVSLFQPAIAKKKVDKDSIIRIMDKVAGWQIREWQEYGRKRPKWDWVMGAGYAGYMALYQTAHNSIYLKEMKNIGDSLKWNTGPNRFMADDYCVAQMFSQVYMVYKQPAMIARFKALDDSIIARPHDESLEWKNNIASREWAWCDALFMGPPALAHLYTATGDKKYMDITVKLWNKTTDYLFDKDENLYYRDSRFFTQEEANGKKVFWSRGNGWVMGGLVRVLDNMPADYPDRAKFVEQFQKMAEKIASLQSRDSTWHAALLDPKSYPVKEASGTGFYCYALAYGINKGLLPYDKYHKVVEKAWKALMGCVQTDGKLGYVQQIGEKPEKVTADDTEVYGVGAFLLAGTEVAKMLDAHK